MERIVSAGAVGCVNASGHAFAGYYADELTDEIVKACRVAALDFQWANSLPAFVGLCRELKRVNPRIKIIAGGISAALLSRELFSLAPLDRIVYGSAEVPFKTVVQDLLSGRGDAQNMQGVLTPANPSLAQSSPRETELPPDLDTHTLDWFPGLRRKVADMHRAAAADPDLHDNHFPFVLTVRGCERRCAGCYGSYKQAFYPRPPAVRSAESILGAIQSIESHEEYHFVNFLGDFISRTPLERARAALPVRSHLMASYYFCETPSVAQVNILANAFPRVMAFLVLRAEAFHGHQSEQKTNWEKVRLLLREFRSFPDVRFLLCAFSRESILRADMLTKEFPGTVRVIDARDNLLEKPTPVFSEDDANATGNCSFLLHTARYQNSQCARRFLEPENENYISPHDLPSDGKPPRFWSGLDAPPFVVFPIDPEGALQPGTMAMLPPAACRAAGGAVRAGLAFHLNGPGLVFEIPASASNSLDCLSIAYEPYNETHDPYARRILKQPVMRLARAADIESPAPLKITVHRLSGQWVIRASQGGAALFEFRSRALFHTHDLPPVSPDFRARLQQDCAHQTRDPALVENFSALVRLRDFLGPDTTTLDWDRARRAADFLKGSGARQALLHCGGVQDFDSIDKSLGCIRGRGMQTGIVATRPYFESEECAAKYAAHEPQRTAIVFGREAFRIIGSETKPVFLESRTAELRNLRHFIKSEIVILIPLENWIFNDLRAIYDQLLDCEIPLTVILFLPRGAASGADALARSGHAVDAMLAARVPFRPSGHAPLGTLFIPPCVFSKHAQFDASTGMVDFQLSGMTLIPSLPAGLCYWGRCIQCPHITKCPGVFEDYTHSL
jgi:hypothetical protein